MLGGVRRAKVLGCRGFGSRAFAGQGLGFRVWGLGTGLSRGLLGIHVCSGMWLVLLVV